MTNAASPPRRRRPSHATGGGCPSATARARRRLAKVLAWLAGIALALVVLELLGVEVLGWFSDLWDALSAIGFGYLLAGWTLQAVKTSLTAFAWYSILRVAFPTGASRSSRSSPPTPRASR